MQLSSHLRDNSRNVWPQLPHLSPQQLGYSVRMLLSTHARWLNSSSDWNELDTLRIGIRSVSAENPAT